jgi:hypothetical protein
VVICDNFGNFGGFCVGHVELVADNVISLGSAWVTLNSLQIMLSALVLQLFAAINFWRLRV